MTHVMARQNGCDLVKSMTPKNIDDRGKWIAQHQVIIKRTLPGVVSSHRQCADGHRRQIGLRFEASTSIFQRNAKGTRIDRNQNGASLSDRFDDRSILLWPVTDSTTWLSCMK
jgi:hypothetical protein